MHYLQFVVINQYDKIQRLYKILKVIDVWGLFNPPTERV